MFRGLLLFVDGSDVAVDWLGGLDDGSMGLVGGLNDGSKEAVTWLVQWLEGGCCLMLLAYDDWTTARRTTARRRLSLAKGVALPRLCRWIDARIIDPQEAVACTTVAWLVAWTTACRRLSLLLQRLCCGVLQSVQGSMH
jgi:hypothetical protein